jgi:hypothetical protein
MNSENYLDSIQIHKISVINSDFSKKNNKYWIKSHMYSDRNFEYDHISNFTSKDLIYLQQSNEVTNENKSYSETLSQTAQESNTTVNYIVLLKNIDKTLDEILDKINNSNNNQIENIGGLEKLFLNNNSSRLKLLDNSSSNVYELSTNFQQLIENIQMITELNNFYKSDTNMKNEDLTSIIGLINNTRITLLDKLKTMNPQSPNHELLHQLNEKISMIIKSEKQYISNANNLVFPC